MGAAALYSNSLQRGPKGRNVLAHVREPWVRRQKRLEPRRGDILVLHTAINAAPSGLRLRKSATHGLRTWAKTFRSFGAGLSLSLTYRRCQSSF